MYERVLGPLRGQPIKILELGIHRGASLKLWREIFKLSPVIVGIDIEPGCAQYNDPAKNVFARIGSQSDVEFLSRVTAEFGPFDLIIDDGSHVASDMIASFNYLFLEALRDEGIYLVEDTHTNYLKNFRNTEFTFIEMAKCLADFQHAAYLPMADSPFPVHAFMPGDPRRARSAQVPLITTLLDEIRFFDSIVVFHRRRKRALPVADHR